MHATGNKDQKVSETRLICEGWPLMTVHALCIKGPLDAFVYFKSHISSECFLHSFVSASQMVDERSVNGMPCACSGS